MLPASNKGAQRPGAKKARTVSVTFGRSAHSTSDVSSALRDSLYHLESADTGRHFHIGIKKKKKEMTQSLDFGPHFD